ncbi:MAG: YceI family protein [Dehalococcoidia bacterium]
MKLNLKTIVGGLAGLAVLLIGGFALWFFVIREDGPEEVSTAGALDALDKASATATAAATGTSAATAAASPTAAATNAAAASPGVNGTWTVDNSVQSFVGYRVKEELANIGGVTAVGRTAAVKGTVTIAANKATAGTITADMAQLKSNESFRDGQLRNQGIEYGKFPTSEFKLTGPVDLPASVESGETVKVTLKGELTLHGVTKAVEVPTEVTLKGGVLVVVGQIPILFADYAIAKPTAPRVVGMEDNGVMELQLFFKKS